MLLNYMSQKAMEDFGASLVSQAGQHLHSVLQRLLSSLHGIVVL